MKQIVFLLLAVHLQMILFAQQNIVDSFLKKIAVASADTTRVSLLYALGNYYADELTNLDSAMAYASRGMALSQDIGFLRGDIRGLSEISYLMVLAGKIEEAKQLAHTGLKICDSLAPQFDRLKINFYRRLGGIYTEANPDSAIYYTRKALQLAQESQDPIREAYAYGQMGYDLLFLGNYPEALKLTLRGVEIANKTNDVAEQSAQYRLLGNVYFFQNDITRSIHYYDTAESLLDREQVMESKSTRSAIYVSKARAYLKLGVLDSALLYANRSYQLAQKNYFNTITARLLNILGNIYEKMGNDSASLDYFHRGIKFSIQYNSASAVIQTYNSLAQYFLLHKKTDSALWYANKAVDQISTSGVILDQPETYRILSEVFRMKNDIGNAYKYWGLMQSAKDSLLGMNKVEQMKMIEFGEQQQKIQEKANELAYKNKARTSALIAGIALLMIIAGLLWRTTNIKQKSYAALKIQQAETERQRTNAEHNLTRLQETQALLIHSEKMASLGELTAGIAHEIQNPLNFVNNFSEVNTELIEELQHDIGTGNVENAKIIAEEIGRNEQKINHHGKRADAIVKSMLQHSKESKGQLERTNITDLVAESVKLGQQGLQTKYSDLNIAINKNLDPEAVSLLIIPQDISRVLLDLFSNSFYAVAEKKKMAGSNVFEPLVSVSTRKNNDFVEIRITDNGIGISKNIIDKVFQPFFTTKPAGQGTGLGLSLSYDIIKAHRGHISVESSNADRTTLLIQLPV